MKDTTKEMISFGGGVNSVAMTIMLVEDGWRGPIVFVDVGGENPQTYCYIDYFEREYLKPKGLEITRLSPATHPELYDDKRLGGLVNTLEEYCLQRGIIPLLAVRWCSVQFKRTPLENWRVQQLISRTCLGFDAGEVSRLRDDPAVRYSLADAGIHRPECRRIIQRAGLDVPVKSGCWFCPGMNLGELRRLYYDYPELYERSIALEDNASEANQKWATLDPHGISRRQHVKRRWQGQMQMDLSQWLPCACRL